MCALNIAYADQCADMFLEVFRTPEQVAEFKARSEISRLKSSDILASVHPQAKPKRGPLPDSSLEVVDTMAEGEPEAAIIVASMIKRGAYFDVLHLDDMNIRGKQIIVAYYHYASKNLAMLIAGLQQRDQRLVDVVNDALYPTYPKAVTYGGARR